MILHEEPNQGRTIIEKFEEVAADIGFAVVLLTADDVGGRRGSNSLEPRGRQNVVFEMGAPLGVGNLIFDQLKSREGEGQFGMPVPPGLRNISIDRPKPPPLFGGRR